MIRSFKMTVALAVCAILAFVTHAEEAVKRDPGEWAAISSNWGHRGAFAIDRATGNLFGAAWNGGVSVSTSQGKSFARADGNKVGGNPFSAYALFAAADGDKLAMFASQGGALSGHSLDGGKTWTSWTVAGAHGFDYGVVDWDSGAILAMPHEEYNAYLSADMGKTWTKLSLGYPAGSNNPHAAGKFKYYQPGIGAFSATEFVYSQEAGTQRTEDGGKTWTKINDNVCVGQVQVLNKAGYWLAKKETGGKWSGILLKTTDKGKTWQPVGKPIENGESAYMTLPRFGKNEDHILIGADAGILESVDGGNTWNVAVPYPGAVQRRDSYVDTLDCFEYDYPHNVFYMYFWVENGERTWKFQRKAYPAFPEKAQKHSGASLKIGDEARATEKTSGAPASAKGASAAPVKEDAPKPSNSEKIKETSTGPMDWPQFRGPSGCGIAEEKGLPTKWSATENVLWTADLPKGNNPFSSPIICKDMVFVASVQLDTATGEVKDHKLLCFNKNDGKPRWEAAIEPGPIAKIDNRGGFNIPTPCTDGKQVYVVFGSQVIAAVDFAGKVVWRKALEPKGSYMFGLSVSPVLCNENVLLVYDVGGAKAANEMTAALMAFDRKTGDLKYSEPRPADFSGYATGMYVAPLMVKSGNTPWLIVPSPTQVQGINPETGKIVWYLDQKHDCNSACSPIFCNGMIYDGNSILPIEGGVGDRVKEVKLRVNSSKLVSPVMSDGCLYIAYDDSITCLDFASGKVNYTQRLAGLSWASPVASADGLIYFASGGKSFVLKSGPKFELVSTNDLGDANHASMAVSNGRLYIRGQTKLWCIGK